MKVYIDNKDENKINTLNIDKILKSMSLREKVGQLFIVGFHDKYVSSSIENLIRDYHVGGIIYFSRNLSSPQQAATLSERLQSAAANSNHLPLFITADQEGGTVYRSFGGTHFPGNMAIGAAGSSDIAYRVGIEMARELKAVGVNLNLAPVLDINSNQNNPVIGVRSYGEDRRLVARLAVAYTEGLQEEGVMACGKHFPGHGDTNVDSHISMPCIEYGQDYLLKYELYPFKRAINAGIDCLLSAHIYYPAIETDRIIPSSLSEKIITGLLRDELGFEGLVLTDCLEMNAILENYGTENAAVMALKAGVDLLLISHSYDKQIAAIEKVVDAVKKNEISIKRIDQSVKRILLKKSEKCSRYQKDMYYKDNGRSNINSTLLKEIGRRSVTLIKDLDSKIPVLNADGKSIAVIDFADAKGIIAEDGNFKNIIPKLLWDEGVNVDYFTLNRNSSLPDLYRYDAIITCTYNAYYNPSQVKFVKRIQRNNLPQIVLAVNNPYDLNRFPEIPTFMTTYDFSPANLEAACDIILGKYKPCGTLPVNLDIQKEYIIS